MKRINTIDPYFENQPPLKFVEELKTPMFKKKPDYFGKRKKVDNEIDVSGIYIAQKYCDDSKNLLETVYVDFERFTSVYEIGGNSFPVIIEKRETSCFEEYEIEICNDKIIIYADDTEGVRRAVIFLEDEIRRKEGPFLQAKKIKRTPKIKSRITRCVFSPINRAPKFGDELSDYIDYYPEEYLNRLMHDGANGVWIYTRFSDLAENSILDYYGKKEGTEKRIAKLRAVSEKCARYGIGVYVFAIEPFHLTPEQAEQYPDIAGAEVFGGRAMCMNSERAREAIYEAGRKLALDVPLLRGFISITAGERPTSCAYVENYDTCPRCKNEKSRGALLAKAVKVLCSGFHSVNPDIEVISWTYGHRSWDYNDIFDYVQAAPGEAVLMQNFDDMGISKQLGKERLGADYWLSYAGPSELFEKTAQKANECKKTLFAKMQVCCSHEIASIPYIPTPGLIFEKYKGAYKYGVTGVMQCWYFGNYPSMMSKAAGELAFEDDYSDKASTLERLAAIYFGQSKAASVAKAWQDFENGYVNYPLNIMFSYFGPAHDSVVWKLALKPKNFPLARTWQSLDPIDGDRIYEALLNGHSLEEAYELFTELCKNWDEGIRKLESLKIESADEAEQLSCAKAIGILFGGTKNILEFYLLRDILGKQTGDNAEILGRMRELVGLEIENSENMIVLCNNDARLGYHSEAEGYKFFPEKMLDRINQLKELLATEFVEVEERINKGLSPLEYYDGIEDDYPELPRYKMSGTGIENAPWEIINAENGARFRMSYNEDSLTIELDCPSKITFMLCPEYRLMRTDANIIITPDGPALEMAVRSVFYYQLFGKAGQEELRKYSDIVTSTENGINHKITLKLSEIGLDKVRPMKMRIVAGGKSWHSDENSVSHLGKFEVRAGEYGWILP